MECFKLTKCDFENHLVLKNKLDSFFVAVSSCESSLLARRASLTLLDAIIEIQSEETLMGKVIEGLRSDLQVRIFEHRENPSVAKFIDKHNIIVKEDGRGFIESSKENITWASMELNGYMMDLE